MLHSTSYYKKYFKWCDRTLRRPVVRTKQSMDYFISTNHYAIVYTCRLHVGLNLGVLVSIHPYATAIIVFNIVLSLLRK